MEGTGKKSKDVGSKDKSDKKFSEKDMDVQDVSGKDNGKKRGSCQKKSSLKMLFCYSEINIASD